jgi:hypothetical protein
LAEGGSAAGALHWRALASHALGLGLLEGRGGAFLAGGGAREGRGGGLRAAGVPLQAPIIAVFILPPARPDGDVAERAPGRPVALAVLAEVPGLVHVVIVVVTKLGVQAVAPRARHHLVRFREVLVVPHGETMITSTLLLGMTLTRVIREPGAHIHHQVPRRLQEPLSAATSGRDESLDHSFPILVPQNTKTVSAMP